MSHTKEGIHTRGLVEELKKVKTRIKTYLRIVYTVKNWLSFSWNYLCSKEKYVVNFRRNEGINKLVIHGRSINYFMNFVNFYREFPNGFFDGEITKLRFNDRDLKFKPDNQAPILGDQFRYQVYKDLDVKNKTVIDIGAGCADSTIYFALGGARKVIGFEPEKEQYVLAQQNIKLNELENVCEAYNCAVGNNDIDDFRNDPALPKIYWKHLERYATASVPMVSLKTAIKIAGENEHLALKVDSEGFEYDTILKADTGTLRAFDEIVMEFHYGCGKLAERLQQCGFKVKCGKATTFYDAPRFPPYDLMNIGLLYAKRI